jgi:hypothetical protein
VYFIIYFKNKITSCIEYVFRKKSGDYWKWTLSTINFVRNSLLFPLLIIFFFLLIAVCSRNFSMKDCDYILISHPTVIFFFWSKIVFLLFLGVILFNRLHLWFSQMLGKAIFVIFVTFFFCENLRNELSFPFKYFLNSEDFQWERTWKRKKKWKQENLHKLS